MISLTEAKTRMTEVQSRLDEELTKVRTGRASASMVDHLLVESYGSKVPVKQVASITTPEPTQILITPWDRSIVGAIESAVRESDLGLNPVNDGAGVRVVLPPLSSERRQQLIKLVGQLAEEARVALRQVRHEALETVKKDPAATEDDKFRTEKQLNELIAEMNSAVDERVKAKETELQTI